MWGIHAPELEDKENEFLVYARFAEFAKCEFDLNREGSSLDARFYRAEVLKAYSELKCRWDEFGDYPDWTVDAYKVYRLRRRAWERGVPGILIGAFWEPASKKHRVYYVDVALRLKIGWRWQKDRVDGRGRGWGRTKVAIIPWSWLIPVGLVKLQDSPNRSDTVITADDFAR